MFYSHIYTYRMWIFVYIIWRISHRDDSFHIHTYMCIYEKHIKYYYLAVRTYMCVYTAKNLWRPIRTHTHTPGKKSTNNSIFYDWPAMCDGIRVRVMREIFYKEGRYILCIFILGLCTFYVDQHFLPNPISHVQYCSRQISKRIFFNRKKSYIHKKKLPICGHINYIIAGGKHMCWFNFSCIIGVYFERPNSVNLTFSLQITIGPKMYLNCPLLLFSCTKQGLSLSMYVYFFL